MVLFPYREEGKLNQVQSRTEFVPKNLSTKTVSTREKKVGTIDTKPKFALLTAQQANKFGDRVRNSDFNWKASRLRSLQTSVLKTILPQSKFSLLLYRGMEGGASGHSLTVTCSGEETIAMLTSG